MSVEIIQNIIPRSLCLAAEAAWPSTDWPYWHRYQGKTADKFGSMDRARIPPACLAAIDAIALAVVPYIGSSFIDYDCHASGLHMIGPTGFLARHIDAECHPIRPWMRTHSIVVCVNSNWKKENGGELMLEHGDNKQLILPQLGQAIVFETENQWHEVRSVNGSCNQYRKTLALFAWRVDHDRHGRTSANFSN